MTIRLPLRTKERLDQLAQATSRSSARLATQAIEEYVATQSWQIEEIRQGLKQADAGDFATPAEVEGAFAKWIQDPVASDGRKKSRSRRRVRGG